MTHYDDDSPEQVDRSRTTPPEPHAVAAEDQSGREPVNRPEVQALIEELTGGDPNADPLASELRRAPLLPSTADPGGDYKQQVAGAKPVRSPNVTPPAKKVQINRRNPERVRTTMRAQKRHAGVPSLKEDLQLLNLRLAEDEVPPSRDEMPTPPSGQNIHGDHRDLWEIEEQCEPTPVSSQGALSQRMSSELEEAPEYDSSGGPSSRRFSLPWDGAEDHEAQSQPKDHEAPPESAGAYSQIASSPEAQPHDQGHAAYAASSDAYPVHDPHGQAGVAEYAASLPVDDEQAHDVKTESLVPQSRDSGEWEVPMTGGRPMKWLAIAATGGVVAMAGLLVWHKVVAQDDSTETKAAAANGGKTIAVPSQAPPLPTAELDEPDPVDENGAEAGTDATEGAGGADSDVKRKQSPKPARRPKAAQRPTRSMPEPTVTAAPAPPAKPKSKNEKEPFVPGANPNY